MRVISISYDLRKPGKDYEGLINQVKALSGVWCHPTLSQWLVQTPLTAAQVRDRLLPFIDANDKLLVTELSGATAWHGLDPVVANWLKGVFGGGSGVRVN